MAQTLEEWAAWERDCLWHEMADDIRNSINRAWSIGAEGTLVRLAQVTKIIGPTEPGAVPWSMLAGGIYEIVLELAGLPRPDDLVARMAEYEAVMVESGNGLSLPDSYARYAVTRAAIREPRQWSSILEELA